MLSNVPCRSAALVLLACLLATSSGSSRCHAQLDRQTPRESAGALQRQATLALRAGDRGTALQVADALIKQYADDPGSMLMIADVSLRCGKPVQAVEWYDRYLKRSPESLPELWQRGIALYFAGDYKLGAAQFEEHRRVNPHDVENAAWHFLCVAKSDSLETARRLVLPAPNDPRVPMEEVLAMLKSGDTQGVKQRMESIPASSLSREQADFYGNFYLGLYADAVSDQAEALRLLRQSAADAPHHYMGDIARVYAQFLSDQAAAAETEVKPE